MFESKKYILSIAGFDPSSGAGVSSDIKTFEAHQLYGLGVCTAVTVQNDIAFENVLWIPVETILAQVKILLDRFPISVVKIGLIENWEVLHQITVFLKKNNPTIKIVLDPIFKASAGFDFHSEESQETLTKILDNCTVITPNYEEIKALFPDLDVEETLEKLAIHCDVYLKGGHRKDKKGWDELYYNKIVMVNLPPIAEKVCEKHGSGCVLSSALASNIIEEIPLEDAAKNAKAYTEAFLNSNESLLGRHEIPK